MTQTATRVTIKASSDTKQPKAHHPWWRIHMDVPLLLATLGLCVCSIIVIKGATANDKPANPDFYAERQIVYVAVGVVLMFLVARVNPNRWRDFKHPLYAFLIGSILLVFALATVTRGSKRWINLPFFNFQPSELGKLILVLTLSAFILDAGKDGGRVKTTLRILALGAFPAMLVMAQPDLGTALVYGAAVLGLLYIAGTPWKQFLGLCGIATLLAAFALVIGPAVGIQVLKPYQVGRLTSFIHPTNDPRAQGYQQLQARIAIGSGEKVGRGQKNATQTALNFLPEHHTDFIFAVVGETYGFAGAAVVLSLYALLVWRALRILTIARNLYCALLAGGITIMLLYQIFVNVGMTVGIMPITGVSAPLLSFGGASMLVSLMAIGLLQAVYAQAHTTRKRL